MNSISEETLQIIFQDTTLGWGSKHPRESLLVDIWKSDRDYLLWAANLKPDKPNKHPLPTYQASLVSLAFELPGLGEEERTQKLSALTTWRALARNGDGLNDLPRPSVRDCQNIISRCNILGAHGDLDGIYSAASAIAVGGALDGGSLPGAFHRLRLFRYGFRSLAEYTEAVFEGTENDNEPCSVIIDFAAHPQATLNLDHHATALSYWEFGTERPSGVFDTRFPSCPSLLAKCCGLDIPDEILSGCDMVDGAKYPRLEDSSDLRNPFVALEFALGVDVSDLVAKKAILTLAEGKLDPYALLNQEIWKARVHLVSLEFEEQRSYWNKKSRYHMLNDMVAVADARLSPYSAARFRYLPFENEDVLTRPYLVTIRPKMNHQVNLGIARNPFFASPEIFQTQPKNLGALAKRLGEGGGRIEASAVTLQDSELSRALATIGSFLLSEDVE